MESGNVRQNPSQSSGSLSLVHSPTAGPRKLLITPLTIVKTLYRFVPEPTGLSITEFTAERGRKIFALSFPSPFRQTGQRNEDRKEPKQRGYQTIPALGGTTHLDLLALDTLPLQPDRANNSQTSQCHTDIPRLNQCAIVRHQNAVQKLRRDRLLDRRGTQPQDHGRIEPLSFLQQTSQEAVREHILADGHEEGSAKGLGKHDERSSHGYVGDWQHSLDGDEGLLHREPDAEAIQDLIADPFGRAGVDGEGGKKAGADRHENGRGVEEGDVVAQSGNASTTEDGEEDESQHEREAHNAGFGGGGAFDRLEPDGEVVAVTMALAHAE